MKALKYSNESLLAFCKENSIELCKDYSNEVVRRKTQVEGKCKTDNCDAMFNKSFRELSVNNSYYCYSCMQKNKIDKFKKTCIKKYGAEHFRNSELIIEKTKQTCLKKYGVECSFQSEQIKDKIKQTCIEKYGVENASQHKDVREKYRQTCMQKYGVEHVSKTDGYKEKYKSTILERYGVEYISQHDDIKQKKIETSLKKYGVEYPVQCPEVLNNIIKNTFKTKPYTFPSGKVVFIQGYENFALDELINKDCINENNIITGVKNVPVIWYIGPDNKTHRHYVDIFIPSQNRCIEVKSPWTAKQQERNIYLKQTAAKNLGYKYEIWIYNSKKEKINCYE
jgi:hypothetical protein